MRNRMSKYDLVKKCHVAFLHFFFVTAELNDRTLLVSHLPRALQLKALIKAFKTSINARFPTKKFRGNRK